MSKLSKLQLAMCAGARAIENNKRLDGSTYVYDVFSDDKQSISYREASQVLRENGESNGWIPVNRRLPEDNQSVLLYALSRSRGSFAYTIGSIDHGCWFTSSGVGLLSYPNGDNYDVIAWQPLPDPYKEEAK